MVAKMIYLENKFNKISCSPIFTWKLIKVITRTTTSNKEDIINVTVNDRTINIYDDSHLVSNAFNYNFTNSGKTLSNGINKSNLISNLTTRQFQQLLSIIVSLKLSKSQTFL